MGLKFRVMLILFSLLLLYGLIEVCVQRFIILPRFRELEISQAQDNLQRALHAIQRELDHLDTQCHDWSAWDDTYRFVDQPSEDYIESNLSLSTFKDMGLNLLYICNLKGKVVWGKIYDLETEAELNLAALPSDALASGHPLLRFPAGGNLSDAFLSGVLVTERGPLFAAARPIFMSGGRGVMRGTLIMGRLLTPGLVARLADQTRVQLAVTDDTGAARELLRDASYSWGTGYPYTLHFASRERLDAITAYPGLQDGTAFVLTTTTTREIMNRGHETMQYALVTLLVAGVFIVIILMSLMKRMILSPISNLTGHVLAIKRTGDLSSRLSVRRRDEIGALATEFDGMLDKIAAMTTDMEEIHARLVEDIAKRQEAENRLHEANRQLQALATIDGLTQLPNRRRFDDVLNMEWHSAIRHGSPLSLILLDVDFFKLYNDTYGHTAGDECLQAIASVIRQSGKRVTDFSARYGGEEFALILPNTEISGAFAIAEAIREQVQGLAMPHDKAHPFGRVTLSAGVSCLIPTREAAMDTLIRMADKVLYEAKAGGRNLVRSFPVK